MPEILNPPPECPTGFKPNPGYLPDDAKKDGARVQVVLASGTLCGDVPPSKEAKLGWEAKTVRWTKTRFWADVLFYKVY